MPLNSPGFYTLAEVITRAIANPVYDGRPAPEPLEQTFTRLQTKITQFKTDIANLP